MRLVLVLLAVAAPAWVASAALAQEQSSSAPTLPVDRIGDAYEISLKSVSGSSGPNGSKGSSEDNSALVERVVGLQNDGVVLEFDLPPTTSAEDRARQWEFPVRVFKAPGRPFQLLNTPELASRVRSWLTSAGLSDAACGHWIFTWTAIKIECDPQSVLQTLAPFDLRLGDLRDGAPYSEPGTLGSAPLRSLPRTGPGATFVTDLQVDPEAVRGERAEADVAVAEMMHRPQVSLAAALQSRAAEQISGTIEVTIEVDPSGRLERRVEVEELQIVAQSGNATTEVTTTLVRQPVPATN